MAESELCVTTPGATFSQPITLKIYDAANTTTPIATSTKTFDVPYRLSASPKCLAGDPDRPGGWFQPSSKTCKNGLTNDVTFNFSNVMLPETVVYEISYDTSHYGPNPRQVAGPYDSLNVAITNAPSVGTTDTGIWTNGANTGFGGATTPAVQFKG